MREFSHVCELVFVSNLCLELVHEIDVGGKNRHVVYINQYYRDVAIVLQF